MAKHIQPLPAFRVTFPDNPTQVVHASSEEEAWRIYREAFGIGATKHTPKIEPVNDGNRPGKSGNDQKPVAGNAR